MTQGHTTIRLFKHKSACLVAALALAASTSWAADATSAADKAFVAKVSQGGMFEVELGKVAEERGSTQDLKDQGTTEAHDHQLVGDKLKSISSEAGIDFATTLNADFQKQLDDLKALSGPSFDKAYLAAMVAIHAKDGAAFAAEAKGGSHPKLRAFAEETHRIVVRHVGELKASGPAKSQ